MLTIGHEEGEAIGHIGNESVYHASFAYNTYKKLLKDLGITVVHFELDDPECGGASVILAQKHVHPHVQLRKITATKSD